MKYYNKVFNLNNFSYQVCPCDIISTNHKSKTTNDVKYNNFDNKITNQQRNLKNSRIMNFGIRTLALIVLIEIVDIGCEEELN